ncbi:elongation of very long chain fatty acids protein 1 isoform X3 [Frankliniella occidentalis]|uniref:Elongation of very long chain fatty acids protein n=1 Tax=Frankliniella occidentalis TaxID=133901 RepID=A0A9C6WWY9_FRAOC|nr:elongation of very long chain fatty acids protein 1 isoform X3 [Frankliniella occidentalis]
MSRLLGPLADVLGRWGAGFWSYADPRTEHLPMSRSPLPVLAIVGAYLYFSLSYGPRFMKNRQPFKLERVMLVYNAVQVVWCAYLVEECLRVGWGGTYNWICEPVNTAKTPRSLQAAQVCYQFLLLKIVDLLDTVFMILRKNARQVSFLHVYHHSLMVFVGWLCVKVAPGEHHTFLGFVNLIVHTIMYSYYFYSLLNPDAKSAQWKRYITLIQFVQFFLIGAHEIISLFHPDCDVIRPFTFGIIVQSAFMTALFKDFYHKAYGQGRNKKEKLNS